jgi:hypothetical protein
MIALQGKIRDMTGVALAFEEIWKKLEEYYSLEDLDELVRICSGAESFNVFAYLAHSTALARTRHLQLRHTLPVLVHSLHCHDQHEDTAIIMDHFTRTMTRTRLVEDRIMAEVGTARPVIDKARRNLSVLHRNYQRELSIRIRGKGGKRRED